MSGAGGHRAAPRPDAGPRYRLPWVEASEARTRGMKLRQYIRHWAAKQALTTPVLGDVARQKLVDLHTRIFLEKADEDRRPERRDHLEDFFAATMDSYVAAWRPGTPRPRPGR